MRTIVVLLLSCQIVSAFDGSPSQNRYSLNPPKLYCNGAVHDYSRDCHYPWGRRKFRQYVKFRQSYH